MTRSSLPKRKASPKRTNPKRKAREFARTYHSKARVEFVKSLPCAGCGISGYSENAHFNSGGMGRKSDYTHIIPLCGYRGTSRTDYTLGCHRMLHAFGRPAFEERRGISLERYAELVEFRWLSHERGSE